MSCFSLSLPLSLSILYGYFDLVGIFFSQKKKNLLPFVHWSDTTIEYQHYIQWRYTKMCAWHIEMYCPWKNYNNHKNNVRHGYAICISFFSPSIKQQKEKKRHRLALISIQYPGSFHFLNIKLIYEQNKKMWNYIIPKKWIYLFKRPFFIEFWYMEYGTGSIRTIYVW